MVHYNIIEKSNYFLIHDNINRIKSKPILKKEEQHSSIKKEEQKEEQHSNLYFINNMHEY